MNDSKSEQDTNHPAGLMRAERHASLRRLAASLSHALGTPLNVISGRAELIELDAEDLPDVLDSAQTIRRQALRISEMLKQVLAHLDSLDDEARPGSLVQLADALRAQVKPGKLHVEGDVLERSLRRADRAWHALTQVLRWASDVRALDVLEIAPGEHPSTEFRVHLRPGVNVTDIRTALEPWIEREPADRRDGALDLSSAHAVQLAVALGHARDAGAELELRHTLDGTLLLMRWPHQA